MLAFLVLLGELCRHGRGLCRCREGASVLAAPLWSSPVVCSSTGSRGRYSPARWVLLLESARGSQGERVPEPPALRWGSPMTVQRGTENAQIFLFCPKRGLGWLRCSTGRFWRPEAGGGRWQCERCGQ